MRCAHAIGMGVCAITNLTDIASHLSSCHTEFHLIKICHRGSPASRAHGNISSQMKFATLRVAMCYIRRLSATPSPLDRRSQCIEGKAWVRIEILCQHNMDRAKLNSDHRNSNFAATLTVGAAIPAARRAIDRGLLKYLSFDRKASRRFSFPLRQNERNHTPSNGVCR